MTFSEDGCLYILEFLHLELSTSLFERIINISLLIIYLYSSFRKSINSADNICLSHPSLVWDFITSNLSISNIRLIYIYIALSTYHINLQLRLQLQLQLQNLTHTIAIHPISSIISQLPSHRTIHHGSESNPLPLPAPLPFPLLPQIKPQI